VTYGEPRSRLAIGIGRESIVANLIEKPRGVRVAAFTPEDLLCPPRGAIGLDLIAAISDYTITRAGSGTFAERHRRAGL
jgi:hypothetical protein